MATKRGQAALEFLSTYGFAFLIILVMIGALSYFGILTPQKFLPGRCLISNEFSCPDRQITRTVPGVTLDLQLVNNLGNTVDFVTGPTMNATSQYGAGPCVQWVGVAPGNTSLVSGERGHVQCLLVGTFPAVGEKLKIGFNINYKELGGSYSRSIQGEVADTIQ